MDFANEGIVMDRYNDFDEKEKLRLLDEIKKDIKEMSLNELTALRMVSSNISKFVDFVSGVRLFFMRDFR
jgi:hypothetical protein